MTQKKIGERQEARPARTSNTTERMRAEETLRDAKQFSEGLLAAMKDGVSVLDARGVHVYVNSALCEMTGFSRDELIGAGPPHPYWPPEEPEEIGRAFEKTMRDQFEDFELTFMRKNGQRFPVIVSPSRTKDQQGNVVHYFATVKDITGRKRAEEALRESERRYRLLAENVTDVIWTTDMDLNLTYVSPSVVRLQGYSPDEIIALPFEQIMTPSSLKTVRRALAEELAMESREQKNLSRSRTLEIEELRKDGSTVWAEMKVTFLRDPDGQPVGLVGVTRDISKRKQAEEALRESERRFRTLSESSFEGIAIHSKGRMLEANQPLATMFGYELSEVIGMHVLDFVAPESRDLVLHTIVSGYREPFEFTGLRKDGSTFPVEVCGRPIPYQGKMVTVAALRDITEHKQAEEALQKVREELENRVERQMERGNSYGLTFRELTALHLVAAGKADKEIGHELGISPLTVHKHLANILSKMGAASRTEAGVRALREGLLD